MGPTRATWDSPHHTPTQEVRADEPRETSAEVAAVVVAEGWAELVQTPAPSASERAVPRSPEDKDAAKQRKTKTLKD